LVVNKTAAIRRVAALLVAQGKPPRPIIIKETLKAEGIEVSSAQVSMALTDTEFAYRRNTASQIRTSVMFPEPALAFQLVGLEDVQKAKKFVAEIGSLEKAMAALVALGQFGGEQAAVTEQTKSQTAADDRSSENGRGMRVTY
jgi:hypothetical protein